MQKTDIDCPVRAVNEYFSLRLLKGPSFLELDE
jgi:hypothetical protein